MNRAKKLFLMSAVLSSAFVCADYAVAQASTFPSKPIRWIVPFPPGGATDVIARLVAQKMSQAWGQTVFIENRAGAAGSIGSDYVAKSAPDGYTLVMGTTSSHAVGPATGIIKLPYDNIKDFAPVTLVATYPNVVVVSTSSWKTLPDLIADLKASPGKYTFGSSGSGSSSHLTGELFKHQTRTDFTHVPYKGTSPLLNDVMGGHVSFAIDQISAVLPMVEGGKLRVLGVASTKRNPSLPDVPAVSEVLPGFEAVAWIGIFAPAGTPVDIVAKIQGETRRILAQPDMQQRLKELGAEGGGNTPKEFGDFVKRDTQKWRDLVKSANLKFDSE